MYGEGISKIGEIIDLAVKLDIIDKGGAWFTVKEQRIQGRDAVKQYLKDNPDICDQIEAEVRENAWKLSPQKSARAADPRAEPVPVDISADDFDQG